VWHLRRKARSQWRGKGRDRLWKRIEEEESDVRGTDLRDAPPAPAKPSRVGKGWESAIGFGRRDQK